MANAFASERLGFLWNSRRKRKRANGERRAGGRREGGPQWPRGRAFVRGGSRLTAHTAAGCLGWQNQTAWFRRRGAMRRAWCAVQPETRRRGSEGASPTRPVGTGPQDALQLTVGSEPGLYRSSSSGSSRDSGSGKSQSQRCVGFLQRTVPRNSLNKLQKSGVRAVRRRAGPRRGERRYEGRRSKEIRPPWLAARQREPEKLKLPGLAPNGNPDGNPEELGSGGPGSAARPVGVASPRRTYPTVGRGQWVGALSSVQREFPFSGRSIGRRLPLL